MSENAVKDDVKITMLGPSGSGKTCFMVGMYATMRLGVEGFTFSAHPNIDLELEQKWEQLIHTSGPERWPPYTADEPTDYSFSFNYGFKPIMKFDWVDYRGKVIEEQWTEESEVQMLIERLIDSSCVLLCISGEYLIEGNSNAVISNKAKIARMNNYLSRLQEHVIASNRYPPATVIVVTKWDHCFDRPKEELIEQVRKLFNPLFAVGTGWSTAVCPVTLGQNLAANGEGGDIDPINVHLPVAFSIYHILTQRLQQLHGDMESAKKQAWEKSGNWWKNYWNRGEIRQFLQEAELTRQELEEVQKNVDLLTKELMRGLTIFFNGKEVSLDG